MNRAEDVLLAYQQNGKNLEPDHGYPIRLIIPGYIGGRMVKWLKKIVVTTQESGNYYHFHDNRVLPSHVDAETAKAEGTWPIFVVQGRLYTKARIEFISFLTFLTFANPPFQRVRVDMVQQAGGIDPTIL